MDERLAYSIPEAVKISGIGRTMLYHAIGTGKLEARKAGLKTLILVDSLKAFVESLPKANINVGRKNSTQ